MEMAEHYALLQTKCTALESLLIQELGKAKYELVDRKSGFIQAGEYGVWIECLIDNLIEEEIGVSSAVLARIEELLRKMDLELDALARIRRQA
jgi:hypothetical protein